MRVCVLLMFTLSLIGCAAKTTGYLKPEIDMSPVGCGYKWFQSGYSPERRLDCRVDREWIHASEKSLAIEDAWRIARARCPEACPPEELEDSVATEDRLPEGRCQDDKVYYVSRVFFRCGPG